MVYKLCLVLLGASYCVMCVFSLDTSSCGVKLAASTPCTELIATPLKPLLPSSISPGYHPLSSPDTFLAVVDRYPSWKYASLANSLNIYWVHVEEHAQPPIAISHQISITTADRLWKLRIWGRSVIRYTVTSLQQVPDVIDVHALEILLSFLEVTPLYQGVQDDNLF